MDNVKEIYVGEVGYSNCHYVLMIKDDGTLNLNWYFGDLKHHEKDAVLEKNADGSMDIVLKKTSSNGIKRKVPFMDKNGNLNEKWSKIK